MAQIDPILPQAIGKLSDIFMAALGATRSASRRDNPFWTVRIHRDRHLGGDRLIDADMSANTVDIMLPRCLVTTDVVRELGKHGTEVLRWFIATTPIVGAGARLSIPVPRLTRW
ncbi:hypothetical protein HNP84_000195 [Thermocatellispora tengchongensis]|uniref:Uncharacterized protein n=1 Tax=Thermocatellispora tengchongensis TaxID=1073253 RepID=A0A840NZS4_9ACTN|nr:hypothetical protein [Thermocatellispora tengchongensis]MBB5130507.1 hypothetical protein [Thermocatellispora tengchongensis]